MSKVAKRYEVLTRSHINGTLHEGGSLVDIVHEHDWKPGPNLREHLPPEKINDKGSAEGAAPPEYVPPASGP